MTEKIIWHLKGKNITVKESLQELAYGGTLIISFIINNVVMKDNNKKNAFRTEAFSGALKINEEMNKTGKSKKDAPEAAKESGKEGHFTTDAFCEALKINEEMNKADAGKEEDGNALTDGTEKNAVDSADQDDPIKIPENYWD